MIAIKSNTWIKPPIVAPVTSPKSHKTINIRQIVRSMSFGLSELWCSLNQPNNKPENLRAI
jgi:hypothetical protein